MTGMDDVAIPNELTWLETPGPAWVDVIILAPDTGPWASALLDDNAPFFNRPALGTFGAVVIPTPLDYVMTHPLYYAVGRIWHDDL